MQAPKTLTENIIKKEAMSFLKGYYKFKPRGEGGTLVKYDMRAEGGLIADGYLEFLDVDGSTFSATLEATSSSKRDEVVYQVQKRLLFWDTLSFSILATVISILLFQRNNWLAYADLKLGLGLLLSWGFLVVYFLLGYLSLQLFDRYRYIYAIEQFTKYNVSEKWICIGEDVFPSGSDKYFKQLKKRCIANGVGLLWINSNLKITQVVSAAKSDLNISQSRTLFKDLDVWVNSVSNKVGIKADLSMQRFAPKFHIQYIVIGFCVSFLSILMYNKYDKFRHVSSDAEEIVEEVYKLNSNQIPEPEVYRVNESALNQYGKQINYSDPKDDTLKNAYREWAQAQLESQMDSLEIQKVFKDNPAKGLDSCRKWKGIGKGYYLIIKGVYDNERQALDQQLFVSRSYEGVGILPAYCMDSKDAYYYVYVGQPSRDSKSVEQILNRMNHDENHVLKPKDKRFSMISL